jgi:hypothetical protein
MTVIAMSDKELDRMQVLRDLSTKQITVSEAAGLMRLTRRQVFRLAKRYRQDGPAALISRRRGRPSNRSHPAAVRTEALALIKGKTTRILGRRLRPRNWPSAMICGLASRRSDSGCGRKESGRIASSVCRGSTSPARAWAS